MNEDETCRVIRALEAMGEAGGLMVDHALAICDQATAFWNADSDLSKMAKAYRNVVIAAARLTAMEVSLIAAGGLRMLGRAPNTAKFGPLGREAI